jgi:hypothetical protein
MGTSISKEGNPEMKGALGNVCWGVPATRNYCRCCGREIPRGRYFCPAEPCQVCHRDWIHLKHNTLHRRWDATHPGYNAKYRPDEYRRHWARHQASCKRYRQANLPYIASYMRWRRAVIAWCRQAWQALLPGIDK